MVDKLVRNNLNKPLPSTSWGINDREKYSQYNIKLEGQKQFTHSMSPTHNHVCICVCECLCVWVCVCLECEWVWRREWGLVKVLVSMCVGLGSYRNVKMCVCVWGVCMGFWARVCLWVFACSPDTQRRKHSKPEDWTKHHSYGQIGRVGFLNYVCFQWVFFRAFVCSHVFHCTYRKMATTN